MRHAGCWEPLEDDDRPIEMNDDIIRHIQKHQEWLMRHSSPDVRNMFGARPKLADWLQHSPVTNSTMEDFL